MCVYSTVVDHYQKKWQPQDFTGTFQCYEDYVARRQIAELRKQVEELVELLKAAKKIDDATDQKDCEDVDKLDLLRQVAALVGIDLDAAVAKAGGLERPAHGPLDYD